MDQKVLEEQQKKELAEFIAKQKAKAEQNRKYEEAKAKERKEYDDFYNKHIADMMTEHGYSEHQANTIFSKAWEQGHAYGYNEVHWHIIDLCDFVDVILKDK